MDIQFFFIFPPHFRFSLKKHFLDNIEYILFELIMRP